MSKIVGFKMGKGRTVRPGKSEKWERHYIELECTCPERFDHESLQEAFARAENIIDFELDQMQRAPSPEDISSEIPDLDIAEINALPWKGKAQEPSETGKWGWIYGPSAAMGIEKGAEKLAEAIEKAEDHKLQLGNMEYSFSKDKAFINKAPVKQESAK